MYDEETAWEIADECAFLVDRDNTANVYAEYTDKNPSVHFMASDAMKAQVRPKRGGNLLGLLRPYLNFSPDSFILFVVCMVQLFNHQSDHFAMVISGPKGTRKSTATDVLREIVDPSLISKNLTPKSVGDLEVTLSNNYVISLDNAKPLSEDMSNVLCAAITGAAASKRKLFQNVTQVIMRLHNAVVINGINVIPRATDLADRALLFETQTISQKERQPESDLMRRFQKDKPAILGAVFDTLARAIGLLPGVSVPELHRMADAHREMVAIALALGIEQGEFQRILDENVQALQKAYSGSNEFVECIVDYIALNGKLEGPTSKVYAKLYRHLAGNRKFFPGSPSAFSRRLGEEQAALQSNGICFAKSKKADANHIRIERIPSNQQTKAQKDKAKRAARQS